VGFGFGFSVLGFVLFNDTLSSIFSSSFAAVFFFVCVPDSVQVPFGAVVICCFVFSSFFVWEATDMHVS